MRNLDVLQAEIRACRKCEEAGYIDEARPLTLGVATARFMVIGQAPSRLDHVNGAFYNGPAGRKLRDWFVEAGFTYEDFGTTVYAAAITKCFPGRKPGSSTDRLPSRAEQQLCRPWLNAEIATVNPEVIVLFGGLAIATFLSRAPLNELIGRAFDGDDGRRYIPLPHSSGASTWLNAPENRALLREAISRLREARERPPE
jgi:uracil-DNA glycosylase